MSIHLSNKKTHLVAFGLLVLMFCLAFFSVRNDSLTFDEVAHIGAGYSYLTQQDMRLNPEHPPLAKDLAALPLLFLKLNFPKNDPSWLQLEAPHWWLQFDLGHRFIYQNNVSPEKIIIWSRLPMILLMVIFAAFVFYWTKKLFNNKAALLALLLFALSPTILAHGRYVTTDVPAAFGIVLAIFCWLNLLKNPAKKNIFFAGLSFAFAFLVKFSAILLIPLFIGTSIIHALLQPKGKFKNLLKYYLMACLVGLISLLLIWPVYQWHIQNLPLERQIRDTKLILENSAIPKSIVKAEIFLSSNKITRAPAYFFFGVLMAINRSSTGNSAYFLGKISAQGFKSYFPIIYALKEPLAFHILTVIAILFAAVSAIVSLRDNTTFRNFIKKNFAELSILLFIIGYWLTSINAKLNIGVRHLMPIIPLTIILVSGAIFRWLKPPLLKLKITLIFGLIIWQTFNVAAVYPHFLAYFNELIGGPKNGYLYATDSNLDWGQDLKRLKDWIDAYNHCNRTLSYCYYGILKPMPIGKPIDKIYIDYFGGGDLDYYLGKGKYVIWDSKDKPDKLPKGSFLAVSVNQLQGGRAKPAKGFDQPSDYYRWLDNYQPVAQIGHSIFVYYID